MTDAPWPVPEGWTWASLEHVVATVESGRRPKGGARGYSEGVLSVGGEHLTEDGLLLLDPPRFVPRAFFEEMHQGRIRKGDVLVVKDGATTGKTAIVPAGYPFHEAAVNEHVFILRGIARVITQQYLFWFLRSQWAQNLIREEKFQGTAQGGINRTFLRNFPIPVPPVPEQEGIAAKLESLDQRLRTTRRELLTARKAIEALRTSVLNQELDNIVADPAVERVPLAAVAEVQGGVTKGRDLRKRKTTRLPYLRVANVKAGYLDLAEMKTIEVVDSEAERYFLKKDDLLFTEGGDADKLGRCAIWDGSVDPCIHQNHIFRARLLLSRASPRFVMYLANSSYGRDYFLRAGKQIVNLASINITELRAFPLPLPSLDSQKLVEARIDELLSRTATIQAEILRSDEVATAILQSALHKAFHGELSAQTHQLS